MVIVTSRGCPLKCSYCSLGSSYPLYRKRSVESVFKEIEKGNTNTLRGVGGFSDEI